MIDKISKYNDQIIVPNIGLDYELERKFRKYLYRNLYNEEFATTYEKSKEEPLSPPEIDLMDPCVVFNYFWLPIRKLAAETRAYDYSMMNLSYDYDNT